MATIVTDAEGPGSYENTLEYVIAVLRENVELKPGVCLNGVARAVAEGRDGEEGRREQLARNMLFSIMHRMGVKRWLDPQVVAKDAFLAAADVRDIDETCFMEWWERDR